ncbi:hypothetical protein MMC09_000205 [Bachmanniomyces sp. S44760]|nr:hypothetical protein [Bachmanniomyces sp. S44760]
MATKNSHPAADSREDLLSMQELEPSPVEETPPNPEKGEYFPSQDAAAKSPSSNSRSPGLGLSGHSTIWWRKHPSSRPCLTYVCLKNKLTPGCAQIVQRIQKYSSYTFTAYLAAHITNTSILPLITQSISSSDTYLLLTRPYYQSPISEPLLVIAPLALHVASGIALRLVRRRQTAIRHGAENRTERRKIAWPRLSGTSALGYVLLPFVAGHVAINRLLPLWVEGGSSGVGLQYVGHTFARLPVISWVGYTALVGVGSFHFVWGWARWLGLGPDGAGSQYEMGGEDREVARRRSWWAVSIVASLVMGVWVAGGLGVVGRGGAVGGWVGRGYDDLLRRIPILEISS